MSSIRGLHTVSYDVYLALLCVSLLSFVHVVKQAQRTSSHRWGCLRERVTDVHDDEAIMFF